VAKHASNIETRYNWCQNWEQINANTKTLLAKMQEMKTNQAKADADRKTYQDMLGKIEANGEAIQERMVAKMNTTLEEMSAIQKEMLAKMEAEGKSDL
jgi:hypothetical protein